MLPTRIALVVLGANEWTRQSALHVEVERTTSIVSHM